MHENAADITANNSEADGTVKARAAVIDEDLEQEATRAQLDDAKHQLEEAKTELAQSQRRAS